MPKLKHIACVAMILISAQCYGVSSAQNAAPHNSKDTYTKIVNVDDRIGDLETEINGLKSRQAQNFEDQFSKLMQLMFVILGLSVTAIIFLGNTWIKERVTALHEAELDKTKKKLDALVGTSIANVGADIYTTIGGHCIDLYKNFDDPHIGGRHHELYKSYVTMAVRIAANAYAYALKLQEFVDLQPWDALTAAEKIKYKSALDRSLNNYVFYLAQRGTQRDKDLLYDLLPKLIKITSDKKTAGEKWWDYEDTVIWAKLHIDRNSALTRKMEIKALIENPNVRADWRISVKERYDLYNKTCAHEAERIVL